MFATMKLIINFSNEVELTISWNHFRVAFFGTLVHSYSGSAVKISFWISFHAKSLSVKPFLSSTYASLNFKNRTPMKKLSKKKEPIIMKMTKNIIFPL